MSRNKPPEKIWIANVITVWGGEDLYLYEDAEVDQYNADPDAYAASHFGLTKIEYYEWLDTDGSPLCSHRTAGGDRCRNKTGGNQLVPTSWKALHRKRVCAAHKRKIDPIK